MIEYNLGMVLRLYVKYWMHKNVRDGIIDRNGDNKINKYLY
jgi:hypothetical protein